MGVPLHSKWSDLGSWESIWQSSEKDKDGNVLAGKVVSQNVNSSLIIGNKRLVSAVDVSDLVIVDTQDAPFVAKKQTNSGIRALFEKLTELEYPEREQHAEIRRPWGSFNSL